MCEGGSRSLGGGRGLHVTTGAGVVGSSSFSLIVAEAVWALQKEAQRRGARKVRRVSTQSAASEFVAPSTATPPPPSIGGGHAAAQKTVDA